MVERVLLLSYAFPPMSLPEAVLSAKRMGNIPGVTVDVLAAEAWEHWMGSDSSLIPYVDGRFGVVRRIAAPRVLSSFPAGALGPLVRLPDSLRLLNRRLVRAACELGLSQYDAVVTWSQWHSVHLAGLALQRRTRGRLPWIAHLSDPWARNPFAPRKGPERTVNDRLEARVFAAADRLLFTSQETMELSLATRPDAWRRKARVVPHAYDPELYPPAQAHEGPVTLRYMGQFYGPRTPEPLFAALVELERLQPGSTRDLVVQIVGPSETSALKTASADLLRPGLVQAVPSVDYVASLELMQSADVLLVVDAPARTSVFLPSKLVDYLGTRRPVVALTPPGAAASLVQRTGGWTADPLDPQAGARALAAGIAAARSVATRFEPTADVLRAQYSVAAVGRTMREVLVELTGPAR
jgi:hypothetical protein